MWGIKEDKETDVRVQGGPEEFISSRLAGLPTGLAHSYGLARSTGVRLASLLCNSNYKKWVDRD